MIATVATGTLGRTVGIMASLMGDQDILRGPEAPHPKEKPLIKATLDSAKYLKDMSGAILGKAGISFTASSLLKQSQVFTGILGSFYQIAGFGIDILLMPLVPFAMKLMRFLIDTVLPELRSFVKDPWSYVTGSPHWDVEDWLGDIKLNEEGNGWLTRGIGAVAESQAGMMQMTANALTILGVDVGLMVTHLGNAANAMVSFVRGSGLDVQLTPTVSQQYDPSRYITGDDVIAGGAPSSPLIPTGDDLMTGETWRSNDAYELNKARVELQDNRTNLNVEHYAQDDMVGFY